MSCAPPRGSSATAYLNEHANRPMPGGGVASLLRKHRKQITAPSSVEADQLWGAAGAAAVGASAYREALSVMADWPQREHREAWMLTNLVNAFMATRDHAAAARVIDDALRLPPDHTHPLLLIWKAALAMYEGNFALAQEALAAARGQALPPYYQFLHDCVAAAAIAQRGQDASQAYEQARRMLTDAMRQHSQWRRDPATRRIARKAQRLIAERRGGLPLLWARMCGWFS